MPLEVHFSEEDWDRIQRDWSAWWAGELRRPMVVIEQVEGYDRAPELLVDVARRAYRYPLSQPASQVIGDNGAVISATRYYGDAFPRWIPDFGPGVVAGFLGAEAHIYPGTVWYETRDKPPLESLRPAYDPANAWWRRACALTREAVRQWGDRVAVGFTDLGGNLDILASLRTSEALLVDLVDAPAEIERLVAEITRLWLRYYDELWEILRPSGHGGSTAWAQMWAPGRFYMLQSDLAYMISPQMFERFVVPDLEALCRALEYPFYHLDGKGQVRHVDLLLGLEGLRGIQWVPGAGAPPAEEWLPLLRRIRDGGKLCQVYTSPEGARTIVRELGGCGFCFVIFEGLSRVAVPAFLHQLAEDEPG
jgi:hypothetical protein